jgi:hypothetical protein
MVSALDVVQFSAINRWPVAGMPIMAYYVFGGSQIVWLRLE